MPDTAALRDAVASELKAMFMRRAEPASPSAPSIFSFSWIDEAISIAPGWRRHNISLPIGDVSVPTPGQIPVLGTLTFA